MIDDVTTKATMVKEGTRRASISSDLKPWPDWFTTLYLFFAHLMLLQDTVISNWCLSYYSVWIWNRKWFITTTSLKRVHQRVPRGGKDHRPLVGCWRLDVGPSHRLPGYCPLSTRSMESWGFICPDSTRSWRSTGCNKNISNILNWCMTSPLWTESMESLSFICLNIEAGAGAVQLLCMQQN